MKAICLLGVAFLVSCSGAPREEEAPRDEPAISAMYAEFESAVEERNLDKIMSFYAPGDQLLAFDAFPPRQYAGAAAYRKSYERFFSAFPGPITSDISDLSVAVAGPLAYSYGVDRWVTTGSDGKPLEVIFRFTDVLRKVDGTWLIVHEHLSVPVDPVTGQADFLSKP